MSDSTCGNLLMNIIVDTLILSINIITVLINATFRFLWPPSQKSIEGEVVLVTGAAHGIGKELALQFAKLGSTVICLDINYTENLKTVELINERGFEAHGYICDVADRDQVMEVAKHVKQDIGDVTIMVNNAGVLKCCSLLEHSHQDIRRMFDTNILSHFWVLEAFLPDMIEHKKGHVVALSSMCGIAGVRGMAAYCATKFAIRGLMESLSEEVRLSGLEKNVHFTSVYPFYVDTGMAPDPGYRFPSLFSVESPHSAAKKIVEAVRCNCRELSIPAPLLLATYVTRLFPDQVINLVMDFLSRRH